LYVISDQNAEQVEPAVFAEVVAHLLIFLCEAPLDLGD
jgi:hypothetical protein